MNLAKPRRLAPAIAGMLLLVSAAAHANDPLADRLYKEGRAAAQAKDWTKACKLFQESQNREPAPGTLLNLADCEEHRGRFITAAAQYQTAARLFPAGDARVKYATEKATALEKKVAKLRIKLEGDGAVESDGVVVEPASFGTFVSMDPGEHVLVVKAKGRTEVRSTIRLAEGESRELTLTVGAPVPEETATPTAAAPAAAPPSVVEKPRPQPTPAPSSGDSRVPAFALLGVGALGIGLGAVTGISALGAADDVKTACPGRQCATDAEKQRADEAADDARTMALVSTLGFGVGIIAAGVGTYFLVRSPSKTAIAPAVGGGSAGFVLRTTF